MPRLIPLSLLLCLLMSLVATVHAQPTYNVVDSIQVTVENPTGFLAPGNSVQINLRVTNPVGSGLVLEAVADANHGSRPVPTGLNWIGADFYPWPELCDQNLPCVVEGQFPIREGESALLAYRTIAAVEPMPLGSVLGFVSIRLRFETAQDDIDVYASHNVAYQVTEDGTGDPAVFDAYLIELPPLVIPSLEVVFDHPESIDAGTHFNLRATITNRGTEPVMAISLSSTWIPLGTPVSEHASFQMQPCSRSCDLVYKPTVNPGESVTWDLANYYYVDELLQDSEVFLRNFNLSASDQSGRRFSMEPDGLPLTITVNGPPGGPVPNPAEILPQREPLELVDFLGEGDSLLVHDPNTGYDWIRLHASRNITQAEMATYLATLNELNGFRLARSSEVRELVLNYLHGEGVPAYEFQVLNGSTEINAALFAFVELIGATGNPGGSGFFPRPGGEIPPGATAGLVADKPGLRVLLPGEWTSLVSITSNDPGQSGISLPRGLMLEAMLRFTRYQNAGHWLVRTHAPPPSFVPEGARYRNDELVIPALQLGEERLAVSMNFRNLVGGLLQVTGVAAADQPAEAEAAFNLVTGELVIPELAVEVARGEYLGLRIVLEYLPESDPPTFLLKSAGPASAP